MNADVPAGGILRQAMAAHQAGRLAEAEAGYREVLRADPAQAEAQHLLGLICAQLGRLEEGAALLSRAVEIAPTNAVYLNNFGEVQSRLGKKKEAENTFRRCLSLAPEFVEPCFNLGNVLKAQGRNEEALHCFREVLQRNPRHFKAVFNLGNTLLEMGSHRSALEALGQAVQMNPRHAEARNNLGVALNEWERTEEATREYQEALKLKPDFLGAAENLAQAYEKQGRAGESRAVWKKVRELSPREWSYEFLEETTCPVIPGGNEEINAYREHLHSVLDRWLDTGIAGDPVQWAERNLYPPSLLMYQGRDDRELKEKFGRLFGAAFREAGGGSAGKDPEGRVHVAFVVTAGHEGVFLKGMAGLLERLDADKFRITVIHSLPNGGKILRPALQNPQINFLGIPKRLDLAAALIREAKPDILSFWEIGTDVVNYFLPFYRLAPVQVTSWGWPVTSGIPAMDYFMSCEDLEPDGAEKHYTEKLERMARLPLYYRRPAFNRNVSPEIDVPKDGRRYLCAQNLRKVHPDFDEAVAEILERDSKAWVLFIEDSQRNITRLLRERLGAIVGKNAARIRFLPRMPAPEYLSLISSVQVCLDTWHYGGGANTCYDAFACGIPVATWPGAFHRGRFALAACRQLGLEKMCVASSQKDYAALAIRLASEAAPERMENLREKAEALFEDVSALREIEAFFLRIQNSDSF
jgi:protein O-GlcNAc transferase